jgi:hypothetical protein
MVASRGSGALTKAGGALHGLVMWGLTTLIGLAMAFLLVSRIVGGVASLGGTAVSGAASAVAGVDAGKIASTFGIDADDALAPVNERLQAEGKPKISAEQLTAATRDIAQDSLRRGRVDREGLVASIAQHTALSRAGAEQVAAGVEQQIKSAGRKGGRTLEDVKTGALAAAEDTGKAFWGVSSRSRARPAPVSERIEARNLTAEGQVLPQRGVVVRGEPILGIGQHESQQHGKPDRRPSRCVERDFASARKLFAVVSGQFVYGRADQQPHAHAQQDGQSRVAERRVGVQISGAGMRRGQVFELSPVVGAVRPPPGAAERALLVQLVLRVDRSPLFDRGAGRGQRRRTRLPLRAARAGEREDRDQPGPRTGAHTCCERAGATECAHGSAPSIVLRRRTKPCGT